MCRPLKSVRFPVIAVMVLGISRQYVTHDEMLMLGGWQDLVVSWASDHALSEPHASPKVQMIMHQETSGRGPCEHPESQTGNLHMQRSTFKAFLLKL